METNKEPSRTQEVLYYVKLIAAAEVPAQVLSAVQSYLNAWPTERVKILQMVDGGWAPFDWNQTPSQIGGVRDLKRIRDDMRRQCVALREGEIELTPELIELDEILFIATQLTESMREPGFIAHSQAATGRSSLLKFV